MFVGTTHRLVLVIYEQMLKRNQWLWLEKKYNMAYIIHGFWIWIVQYCPKYILLINENANVSTPWSPISGPDKRYNDKILNVNDDPRGTISPRQSRGSLGPLTPLPSHKTVPWVSADRWAAGCFSMSDPILLLTAVDKFLCSSAGNVCGNDHVHVGFCLTISVCSKYQNLRMMWPQHNELLYLSSHTGY